MKGYVFNKRVKKENYKLWLKLLNIEEVNSRYCWYNPINGELIIAFRGSDLSVHQEGLLFVGVEGNVLTPSNKILTGSATIDVTGGSFDHSVDGIPYYETDAKKLHILGKGGNLNVEFTTNSLDLKGSGIVSSSSQVSALAGINDSTLTITAGDGLKTGGTFTTNQSGDSSVTLNIDVSDFAGTGLEADGSENLRIASSAAGNGLTGGAGSALSIDLDGSTLSVGGSGLKASDGLLNTSLNSFTGSTNLTIAGNSVAINGGSVTFANIAKGTGTLSGSAGVAGLVTDTAVAQAADSIVFFDADDNLLKRDSIGDFLTAIAGDNLSVSSNQLVANAGDITGVTAGAGLVGGGNSGAVTLAVAGGVVSGSSQVVSMLSSLNSFTASNANTSLNSFTASNANTSLNSFTASAGDVVTLDVGISNNNVIQATSGISDDDFLRINGTKVEGLDASEVRSALNVADGAQANVATNLGKTTAFAQITITSSTGNNVVIGEATDSIAGLMSTTHHDKLDGIESNATADQTGAEIATALNSDLGGNFTIGNQSDDTATFSGGVTIDGDLIVNGTTTYVSSSNINIGDNIMELNYAGTAADAGLLVKDAVGTGTSGSLLWDASEDYWIAGALGSEARVVVGTGTGDKITKFSSAGVIADSILSESGTTLTISNNVIVSGLTASQLVVTNGSKQLVSSTDISSLTLTLDGGEF